MISQKITALRKQSGLTQTEMASHLQVSRQAYSFYELGKHEMDYKSLCIIADIFNVSTDYLLGRYDTRPFLLDSDEEIAVVKKYRLLDDRGRRCVQLVLENECTQTNNSVKKTAK